MIFLASILVALSIHLVVGWQWSIAGGLLAGVFHTRTGWLTGTMAVGISWALLILYNFVAAPEASARFLVVTGGILGNLSGPMVVVVTVLIGALVGLLGGLMGSLLRTLADDARARQNA